MLNIYDNMYKNHKLCVYDIYIYNIYVFDINISSVCDLSAERRR